MSFSLEINCKLLLFSVVSERKKIDNGIEKIRLEIK